MQQNDERQRKTIHRKLRRNELFAGEKLSGVKNAIFRDNH